VPGLKRHQRETVTFLTTTDKSSNKPSDKPAGEYQAPESIEDVQKLLRDQVYISDRSLAVPIFLALKLQRPLFLEGEAGVGKTEIARALAAGLNTKLIRLQCYEGLDINQSVYEWNHARQILEVRLMEASGDVDRDSANADLYSERFLIKRPLLQAIDEAEERPPVLLIDELDRSDEEFEGFLLELLADYQITIPELGTFKAAHPPIVIITSNRTREIHDALKRRCLYAWVDYPDYQKELQIISARLPDAPKRLAEQVTAFIQEMRETELFKIPGITETLDWLSALLALNQTELDPAVIDDTLGMMLKYQDDIESVKGEPVRAMLERSKNRGPRRGGRGRG
jgi:MoxR-like ATPase